MVLPLARFNFSYSSAFPTKDRSGLEPFLSNGGRRCFCSKMGESPFRLVAGNSLDRTFLLWSRGHNPDFFQKLMQNPDSSDYDSCFSCLMISPRCLWAQRYQIRFLVRIWIFQQWQKEDFEVAIWKSTTKPW